MEFDPNALQIKISILPFPERLGVTLFYNDQAISSDSINKVALMDLLGIEDNSAPYCL